MKDKLKKQKKKNNSQTSTQIQEWQPRQDYLYTWDD